MITLQIKWVDLDAILALWQTVPRDPLGRDRERLRQSLMHKLADARSEQPSPATGRRYVTVTRPELELLLTAAA